VSNSWLDRVNYQPYRRRPAGGVDTPLRAKAFTGNARQLKSLAEANRLRHRARRAADRAKQAAPADRKTAINGDQKPNAPFRSALVTAFATIIASAVASIVATFGQHHLSTQVATPVPEIAGQRTPPLFSSKLEKFETAFAMHKLLTEVSPNALIIESSWNFQAPQHFVFGHGVDGKPWFYALLPRKGWESAFSALRLQDLKLYEIHVRPDIDDKDLENHLYRWAAGCSVQKEWIEQWSSWRIPYPPTRHNFPQLLVPNSLLDLVKSRISGIQHRTYFVIGDCDSDAIHDFIQTTNSST